MAEEAKHEEAAGAKRIEHLAAIVEAVRPRRPSAPEAWILAAGCTLFLLVNAWTSTWFPVTWIDEVYFTDPAANLALGRGFHSTAGPSQPSSQLWANYNPLYSLLLAGWLKLLGVSAPVARSFNGVIAVAGVVMLWLASARLSLLERAPTRLVFAGVALSGTWVAYRFGRVDATAMMLAAATALAWSIDSSRGRRPALFVVALLSPIAAFQLLAYLLVLGLLLAVFARPRMWMDSLVVASGWFAGLVLLLVFYAANGVMVSFLINTLGSSQTIVGVIAHSAMDPRASGWLPGRLATWWKAPACYLLNPSFVPLLAGLALGMAREVSRGRRVAGSLPAFGLLASLVVPVFVLVAGKYPFYYSWMGLLPLALGTCRLLEDLQGKPRSSGLRAALGVAIAFAGAVGWPWALARTTAAQRREFGRIQRFVESVVRPEDWVYGEAAVYYPVMQRASRFVFVGYANSRRLPSIPEEERRRISVLIVPPDQFEPAARKVGGAWVETGQRIDLEHSSSPLPDMIDPLLLRSSDIELLSVSLAAYRRAGPGPGNDLTPEQDPASLSGQ